MSLEPGLVIIPTAAHYTFKTSLKYAMHGMQYTGCNALFTCSGVVRQATAQPHGLTAQVKHGGHMCAWAGLGGPLWMLHV